MTYLLALSTLTNVLVVWAAFHAVQTLTARRDATIAAEREQLLGTVGDLCQRIQAPELAVIDHQAQQAAAVNQPAVAFDSDEDYWQAVEMTKEQVAEQMMAHELEHKS